MITTGSHFSGYGSYIFALKALGIQHKSLFACDFDKYARLTYLANHDTKYFYSDVSEVDWTKAPYVDLFITSPPCQSFSMAGKRKGDAEKRGVLFQHSHEYIKAKRPRFFLVENVPGLLSFEKGRVFDTWLKMLAKTINGQGVQYSLFEDPQSYKPAGYHIKWIFLNSKEVGWPEPLPHNRNRVFIIGFRDIDDYRIFTWPKKTKRTKKLLHLLDDKVGSKYFMTDKMNNFILGKAGGNAKKVFRPGFSLDVSKCIISSYYKYPTDSQYIAVKSKVKGGFSMATKGDYIDISFPGSNTKRRVRPGYIGALDTKASRAVIDNDFRIRRLTPNECRKLLGCPEGMKCPNSETQMYKQFGNSIVVNVLSAIFKQLPIA